MPVKPSAARSLYFSKDLYILTGLALLIFIFHLFDNLYINYGIFRDEYYYLACAERLSWGYVDHPPFSIFILACTKLLFGNSLFAIRLVPAIALGLTVLLTGLTVRAIGGKTMAIMLAAVAVMVGPIFLAMGSYYSMNSIDILLWSVAAYVVILISQYQHRKYWIFLGIIMGIGLMNKLGFLWLGFGLFIGLLATPQRKSLLTPWPYITAGIALLIFLPFIIWNVNHDFAHIEFMQNAIKYKYNGITKGDFVLEQFLMVLPTVSILTFCGLYFFFFDKKGRNYAILGIIFLSTFLILLINGHSKGEYLAASYPLIYTGGGIVLERLMNKKRLKWIPYTLIFLLATGGIIFAPIVTSLLPVKDYISYSQKLGMAPESNEGKEMAELPSFFADRFGWESLAEDVSKVYVSLPEDEQTTTVAHTQNYGEAASLEYYSKLFKLPKIVSGHNSYWYWGNGGDNIKTVIVVGSSRENLLRIFSEVDQAAVHQAQYAMPYESNLPIFVCRKLKVPGDKVWEMTKNFN